MGRAAQLWALRRAATSIRPWRDLSTMASGHSELIRVLRERTGAPIKDVKEMLVKCDWDQDAAFTELRKKGLAAASKKASRLAAEGLLGLAHFERGAAVVEINSETDFVARNELFQNLVLAVAQSVSGLSSLPESSSDAAALDIAELEDMKVNMAHTPIKRELAIRDAVTEVAAMTGENVKLRRVFHLRSPQGIVSSYLHTSPRPGLGRIAGLVSLEVDTEQQQSETVATLGSNLAMHVVAARPSFLSKASIDPSVLEEERNICRAQASATGKPAQVIDKMVEGRLSKFYEDQVLLEQKYVADDSKRIQALLDAASKELGKPVKISSFLRLAVGEGINKYVVHSPSCLAFSLRRVEKDFAAEVAAAAAR